jgi:hypothetical protein
MNAKRRPRKLPASALRLGFFVLKAGQTGPRSKTVLLRLDG